MNNSSYTRAALAKVSLDLAPPLIRRTLLDDSVFREEYGFKTNAVLSFYESDVTIQRSGMFEAVRAILSGASEMDITDTEGRAWKLGNDSELGEPPILTIRRDRQRLTLPDLASLSPTTATRIGALERAATDVNLPIGARDAWRNVLSARPFEDDEVDKHHSDLRETPVHVSRSIHKQIADGESSVSTLVPHSRRYFERLVGGYDGSDSIRAYSAGRGRALFDQLSAWRTYDGFLHSLLLSSHSSLTAEIDIEHLGRDDLVRAFGFLETQGDRISQLGAIEIGFRALPENPEIEPFLIGLIEQIRDDDADGPASGFSVLSALFVLVDGELSRTRLLSDTPPFYRRLASLSQAALIQRQLVSLSVEVDSFHQWAFSQRGQQFYVQSLADMRLEPRWNPELAAAAQIKADFFGRIMIAARNTEENVSAGLLHDLTIGTESGSLTSLSEFPRPYLPGPLEGGETRQSSLPADLAKVIEGQLHEEVVGASSFVALVNSAQIFRVDLEQAELAASALKLSGYRLANVDDRSQLLAILDGLATVAAVARGGILADELRILLRRYRRDGEVALSMNEAMRISLVAAASRANLNDWREFTGEWLTEFAFGDLEGDDSEVLSQHLNGLCHAVPELWVSCGRAHAAIQAFSGR